MTYLLDTHILLWWVNGEPRVSRRQARILKAVAPDHPLLVSGITLWEIATLYELGRIQLSLPLREWLEQAVAPPLVRIVSESPAIAAAVADLPKTFHRDPADRLIVATARILGATLLTQDDRIIDAAIVPTVA